ncbi:Polyketide synthase PksM [Actinomadura rubteroloni]|uniref:Polyketide synthase PksM n=1 Tax=Actinomadura rubteroloni TaxID=1926885 RepID=A0A2P4UMW1_9ACTN|nr:non-ribosomal peptide synthetase [Actinomadura rubteroloni]POM26387.1 Polyketide synthase PksM [Actinomadura rubteroloni]
MTDPRMFAETFKITADNPLVGGHVVYGDPFLPGVGHVELVLEVLARNGVPLAEAELRSLVILEPLVVRPDAPVTVTLEGRPAPAGGVRVEVRGRAVGSAEVLHATAVAEPGPAGPLPGRLDLPADAPTDIPMDQIYAWCRDHDLVHSGMMKPTGTVHRTPGSWVAEVRLAEDQRSGADRFLFHPALFEAGLLGAGVAAGMLYDGDDEPGAGLYLPLAFESFRATAPLGDRCYVRVPAEAVRRDDELIRMSLEFFDAQGRQVARLDRFAAKRVRAGSALRTRSTTAPRPAPAAPRPAPAAPRPAATAAQRPATAATPPAAAQRPAPAAQQPARAATRPAPAAPRPASGADGTDLVELLRDLVASRLGTSAADVSAHVGYYQLGLASADLVGVVAALEDRLSLALSPTVIFEHTTIAELAAHVEMLRGDGPAGNGVLAELRGELAALLSLPAGELDETGEFTELGLDLAGGSAFVEWLNDRYGLALTPAALAAHPTVGGLADHVAALLGGPDVRTAAHPMLGPATDRADGVVREARFDGGEGYLRDHRVRGTALLPGVVHLELARSATAAALGAGPGDTVRLEDVAWLRPAASGPDGLNLRVTVRGTGGRVEFEITGDDGAPCCLGRASLAADAGGEPASLAQAREACAGEIPVAQVYDGHARAGLAYGPAQRSLTALRTGTDAAGHPQVLAELSLPADADPLPGCVLHPAILDGALQATAGLRPSGDAEERRPALPFSVGRIDVHGPTPARAFAWTRYRPGNGPDTRQPLLDVTVFDESGRVAVDLAGLATRALPAVPAEAPAPADGDVAIVGVAGRYPQAADLDAFWENLRSGRDCVTRADRWADGEDHWGGFLDGIDLFDPVFFQISQREAEYLDPHERLFLECAHHVLEDAGYTGDLLSRTSGKVGVFTGVMYQDYQLYGAQAQERGLPVALSASAASVANRVSYFYGFTGPSMTVDTMCSSSLTALHLACEAIRSGQIGAALVGGVNLTSHPGKYLLLGQRDYLAGDGRCRSFGEGGDGYVPGEGVGAVLLKPLAQAVRDGDHIHAVIKGTAVNHGGRTTGYSVPSPAAQSQVIVAAIEDSGVDPRTVGYLEAHGTGTSLGDPIEIAGLTKAFRALDGAPEHLAVGSVKSNIGHAESAAGIAGITKVLLQLRHGQLVPSLHSATLNPRLGLDGTPLSVQQDLAPWPRPAGERSPRVAGVSSFGAGGANAHVVLAEYEQPAPPSGGPRPQLFVLSAMSEAQLAEQARRLAARLGALTEDELPGVAWTLQTGRLVLEERLAFAADSVAEARALLTRFADAPDAPGDWLRGSVYRDVATDEAELAGAVAAWSGRSDAGPLLRAWTAGATVPWETVRTSRAGGPPPRRVPLPGYPFARERCWVDLGEPAPAGADASGEVVLLRRRWVAGESLPPSGVFAARAVVVFGALAAAERETLRAALPPGTTCRFFDLADGTVGDRYTEAVTETFAVVQEMLRDGGPRPALLQVVLTGPEPDGLGWLRGLTGLLRTASLEDPRLRTQLLDCLDGASAAQVADWLTADAEPEVRYRDGRRYTAVLDELGADGPDAAPWRENGVYLVTGGAGALGRIIAADVAASVGHATVVLVGRSALTAEQAAALDALRAAGLTVEHRRADVADRAATERLLAGVRADHGPLTGIVHGAGSTDDRLIVAKSAAELERVLAPKVAGLVHLDELSRDEPLEFLVCLSSASGVFGNPGQADYAAANAFLDAYTAHRERLVAAGERSGRSVSIGWPLWADGGMGTDAAVADRLRAMGVVPLDTRRGLAALHRIMSDADATAEGGTIVYSGTRETLSRLTAPAAPAPAAPVPAVTAPAASAPPVSASADLGALEERTIAHLRRVLAGVLKIAPERIHPDAPLERYGMDSVLAVETVTSLEEVFGPLARTLLFEWPTLRDLAGYLVADHAPALRALVGEPAPAPAAPAVVRAEAAPAVAEAAPARSSRSVRGSGDVAVIGMAGRYPQAADPDALWDVLRDGRDCVTGPPAGRWDGLGGAGSLGGFLDGIDRFDAALFGVAPREAEVMDPQQRLFLETVWELLESCGVTQDVLQRKYERRVGVYVGAAYQLYRADAADPALAALTSTASYNLIANRVSHFFGLEGPSLAVDSMCTSSTVAIHLACADLARGESELAVAGGVNLAAHPDKFRGLAEMRLLGTHAGSRSFRAGDGYLPAEAVGAVLLKPLDAALRDGDTIHAVIKGTASAHSGRGNGFLAPSRKAQETVMRRALENAGVAPETIGYVESSANGTAMSDEIELSALREVFADAGEPVAVGSVKSNLGHPEAASGVAQLTKVALQFRHRELPPLAQVGAPNPDLGLDGGPLVLCERLTPWAERSGTARRALINSVAAGGSHVSLVVEAPPEIAREAEPDTRPQLVVLSAPDTDRLREAARRLDDYLAEHTVDLVDVAATLHRGREAMAARLAVVAGSVAELRSGLARYLAGDEQVAAFAGPVTRTGDAADDTAAPLLAMLDGVRGEAFLAALAADRDLDRLAELWVRGVPVPWDVLHTPGRRLLPLPGTVFRRGGYWLDRAPAPAPAPVVETVEAVEPGGTRDVVLAAVADVLGYRPDEIGAADDFLALGGHSLLAHRLSVRLRDRGVHCDPVDILRARSIAAIADAAAPEAPPVAESAAPLMSLTEEERATVAAAVPGGAANVQDAYPLAPMQEGMYLLYAKDGHDPYVSSGLFAFADRAALDRFVAALRAVTARHDALRTVILSAGLDRPLQAVLRDVEVPVEEIELTPGRPATDQLEELLAEAPPIRLDRAPLIRLRAGRHPDTGTWHAAMSLHHVIHDASSLGLLFGEIVAHAEGRAETLPEPPHYRDFVAHTLRQRADLDPATFFTGMLGDVDEPTVVFGLRDVHGDGRQVLDVRRPLPEALGRRVRAVAAELRTSPAVLFHAGWALVVAACANRDDVVFGTVMSGRMRGPAGVERMIGTFINTLPIRFDLAGLSARDLVTRAEEQMHGLVRHEQVPLGEAKSHSALTGPEAPLFNVIFNYRQLPDDERVDRLLARVGVTPLSEAIQRNNFPVTVSVDDHGDAFEIDAQIHRAQSADAVIDCLETAMASLLDALADESADLPALGLSVTSETMLHRELVEHGWTAVASDAGDADRPLHRWFEDVARERGGAVAVRCDGRELSYTELNSRANRLARRLRERGVGRGSLVALCLPRGEWLVVGALAVVKAGGAYVPVDPSAPAERTGHVLRDSAPKVVLVAGGVPDGLTVGDGTAVVDVENRAEWADLPDGDLEPPAESSAADLAYVIYTSGSTGLPKGVMIEHRHVTRFFLAAQEWFGYRRGDVWTLFHSFAFDFTVWEMWGALLHGGLLVVVTRDVARSPRAFYELLCDEGVTVLGQTPTGFGQLIEAQDESGRSHRVRTVVLGGEPLDATALRPWFERPMNADTTLVNMWGTTETTVVTNYREVEESETRLTTRPIGTPMPGLGVYVLDRNGRPMPTGGVGELVIAGGAVGRGYLNRPELTAERFLPDPFRDGPDARMYRTGDLGRRLPDGSLEFLGRNDDQVKIRGYRIELGEISARLNDHPAVEDSRVVVRGDGDDRRLVAYVVPSARTARPVRELRRLAATDPAALADLRELPNGLPVFGRDGTGTRSQRVFDDASPLRHGITLAEDARVVDLGAGSGLGALFAGLHCPDGRVYAYEPEPAARDALRRNAALYGLAVEILESADPAEAGTDRIDLLLLDAERVGYDVLRSAVASAEPVVDRLVVGLRDVGGRHDDVMALLKEHGFDAVSEPDDDVPDRYDVYARRTGSAAPPPRPTALPRWTDEQVLLVELDSVLRVALPPYMVPSGYAVLHELPLTGNGKLDQRALPEPEAMRRPDGPETPPGTDAEHVIAAIWSELLHLDPGLLSTESDFFALGGNSLLVTRVINMVKQRTGAELRVQTVFDAHRLAELAAVVESCTSGDGPDAALDLDEISRSISLIESLTDAELGDLDLDTAFLDSDSQAERR